MKRKPTTHSRFLDGLEQRLRTKGYQVISREQPYYQGTNIIGEPDFVTVRTTQHGTFFTHYEAKPNMTCKQRKRAKKQIRTWKEYMVREHNIPYSHLRGVIIGRNHVERY